MKVMATAHITFGIRSDTVTPGQVTTALGIQPSHAFSKGDVYETPAGLRYRPFNVWQLRSESDVDSLHLEEHAAFILNHLEPVKDRIEAILADSSHYVEIRIWWEFPSDSGGFSLSSTTITRLASLCKEFNFTYIA